MVACDQWSYTTITSRREGAGFDFNIKGQCLASDNPWNNKMVEKLRIDLSFAAIAVKWKK